MTPLEPSIRETLLEVKEALEFYANDARPGDGDIAREALTKLTHAIPQIAALEQTLASMEETNRQLVKRRAVAMKHAALSSRLAVDLSDEIRENQNNEKDEGNG